MRSCGQKAEEQPCRAAIVAQETITRRIALWSTDAQYVVRAVIMLKRAPRRDAALFVMVGTMTRGIVPCAVGVDRFGQRLGALVSVSTRRPSCREDVGGQALLSVLLLEGLLPEGGGELEGAAPGPGREQAQEVAPLVAAHEEPVNGQRLSRRGRESRLVELLSEEAHGVSRG